MVSSSRCIRASSDVSSDNFIPPSGSRRCPGSLRAATARLPPRSTDPPRAGGPTARHRLCRSLELGIKARAGEGAQGKIGVLLLAGAADADPAEQEAGGEYRES